MSLTVKRVARLMRRGDKGRHLDGGASGQRGLYLVVAHKTAAHWELDIPSQPARPLDGAGQRPHLHA